MFYLTAKFMKTHVEIEIDYRGDALRLVQMFVKEKLDGDVTKLATFDLASIRDDIRFGNSDKHQGIEQMRICKAICALCDCANDTGLTYDKLIFGKGYQMKKIASSDGLCKSVSATNEEDLHLYNLPIDLLEKIDLFKANSYTIGNVIVEKASD